MLVETTCITKSYPSEVKEVTSIIYNYFKEIGNEEAVKGIGTIIDSGVFEINN